ncbi:hypothetical protein [Actinoplanes sp. HUAS TT8]|uniref:zf-HC2 domain-containing protein n=1 Tax=Actinoplanes sp. HUAS TT8 TaxID=3447453 RepID=UPI003F5250AE
MTDSDNRQRDVADLVARIRSGDRAEAAWAELLDARFRQRMYRSAGKITKQRDWLDTAWSAATMVMVTQVTAGGLEDPAKFEPYFRTTFHRLVLKIAAKESATSSRFVPLREEARVAQAPSRPVADEDGKLRYLEERVLRVMPQAQLEALRVHLTTGKRGEELAAELSKNGTPINANAAAVRLNRARDQVREALTAVHLADLARHARPGTACPDVVERLGATRDRLLPDADRKWLCGHHRGCRHCRRTLEIFPLTERQMTGALNMVGRTTALPVPGVGGLFRGRWAGPVKDALTAMPTSVARTAAGITVAVALAAAVGMSYSHESPEPQLLSPYTAVPARRSPAAAGPAVESPGSRPDPGVTGPTAGPHPPATPDAGRPGEPSAGGRSGAPGRTEGPRASAAPGLSGRTITSAQASSGAQASVPAAAGPASEGPASEGPAAGGPTSEGPAAEGPTSGGPTSEVPAEPEVTVTAEAVRRTYVGPCPPPPESAPTFRATIRVSRGPVTVTYQWLTGNGGSSDPSLKTIVFDGSGPQERVVEYIDTGYLPDRTTPEQARLVVVMPVETSSGAIPFSTTCVTSPQVPATGGAAAVA